MARWIPSASCRFCDFRVSVSPMRVRADRLIASRNDHEWFVHYSCGSLWGKGGPQEITKAAAPQWTTSDWLVRAVAQGFQR